MGRACLKEESKRVKVRFHRKKIPGRVAPRAFDCADTTTTEGAPILAFFARVGETNDGEEPSG